jgi:hypothetical protein
VEAEELKCLQEVKVRVTLYGAEVKGVCQGGKGKKDEWQGWGPRMTSGQLF